MELRHVRYFVVVAEELSFTRAAERLHTAQSSLSQQIQDLEHELGTALLFRTKRRVELTDAGRVLLLQGRLILDQVEHAILEVRQTTRAEAGELIVGYVPSAEVRVFPELFPFLNASVPNLRLTLRSMSNPELREARRKGSIHVAFLRWLGDVECGIEHRVVLRQELKAYLHEKSPLCRQSIVSLKSLEKIPFVGISAVDAPELRQVVHDFCEKSGCKLTTVQETNNLFTSLSQIGMGIGFGILPDYQQDLLTRNVLSRPIEGHPSIELYVAWRSSDRSALLKESLHKF
jgi:LysR family hca operon transcriptional activator